MPEAISCKVCGSTNLHHSRLKGWLDTLRWRFSQQAPFRCRDCQWRGWLKDPGPSATEQVIREVHKTLSDDDLERIDPGDR